MQMGGILQAIGMMILVVVGVGSGQSGETVSFDAYFTGGLPFCSQCGSPGQYACSPDSSGSTLGNWNNGTISFMDPLPQGHYATQLAVTVSGAFSCNGEGGRVMFGLLLNGLVHGVRESVKGTNQCKCDTCDGAETFSFPFRNGVPHYRPQSSNSLRLDLYRDSLCVNRVQVAITYSPMLTSPPTPMPEVYLPLAIPKELDRVGCAVCNGDLAQWCSAANNNSLVLSFRDPLPSGVYLISADVFLSLNLIERAAVALTTITAKLQETVVGTGSVGESGWRDKCGCLSDHQLQSALYQRGWPGYAAGGINRLSLTANKYSQPYGNVCVGRLALKLVYYQASSLDADGDGDGAAVLKSLYLHDLQLD